MMTSSQNARLAGVLCRSGLPPGRLLAQRQAGTSRQTLGASVRRALHRCGEVGRTHAAGRLRRHRSQELHHRSRRMRSGVSRLRQRRVARFVRPQRHASRGGTARYDQSPLQEQPRRHVHGCHGQGRPDPHRLGIGRHRRRLRQRRIRRPLSSPTTGTTCSIGTTAMARSPM